MLQEADNFHLEISVGYTFELEQDFIKLHRDSTTLQESFVSKNACTCAIVKNVMNREGSPHKVDVNDFEFEMTDEQNTELAIQMSLDLFDQRYSTEKDLSNVAF